MKTFGDHFDQTRQYEQEITEFTYLTKDTHTQRELGSVDGNSIYLFESKSSNGIMITSGWQGDEPAGWIACKTLCKQLPSVSFIPYVSPACFKTRQHRNDYGRNVDRGWPEVLTPEGKVLQANISELVRLSKNGLVSLHEDPKRFISYFYGWNLSSETEEIIQIKLKKHFPLTEDAKHTPPDRGLFSEYMISKGIKAAVQLETPADGSYTISVRRDCLIETANAVINSLL